MRSRDPAANAPRADVARSAGSDLIYRNVLDNVASGVMSLDPHGVIMSFNAAAAAIVGLPSEQVVGHTFADIFSQREGADEFCDVILDAVYDSLVGHQRVVEATFAARTRSLSVATSFLKEERGGETVRLGVVAVFNDISEIRELREKEFRLAKEVEAKHAELRDAYVTLEARNRELGTVLRKARALRIGAAIVVLAVFVGIGLYTWNVEPHTGVLGSAAQPAHTAAPGELSTLVVEPQRISSTITVAGQLAPRREVEVTSPIDGKVAAIHFQPGERVDEGQRLVDLDISGVQIEYGEARVAHIKALERVKEFEDWSNHVDVSRARRAVSKSRMALETRRNRFEETAFLLERGVIPASEHEATEREYHSHQLDLQSAEQDLESVLAKGVTDGEVARVELETARARLQTLEETIAKAAVNAPVSGVVMHPTHKGGEESGEQERGLARGASVGQGDSLLTIGDLDGLTVVGRVDEVDVATIRPGQPARIVGDAFPGVELHGTIDRVSSQAIQGKDTRSLPSFEIAAVVESLTEDQRRLLRLGMSASLEAVVYDKADALLVPIGAVELHESRPRLRVRNKDSGAVRHVPVVTGLTTVDAVEILEGIEAGDHVLIPGR